MECWFSCTFDKTKKSLDTPRKRGCKITERQLETHIDICNDKVSAFVNKIMKDETHPLHPAYQLLPSGRRLRVCHTRTSRFRKSFVPYSVRLYNSER